MIAELAKGPQTAEPEAVAPPSEPSAPANTDTGVVGEPIVPPQEQVAAAELEAKLADLAKKLEDSEQRYRSLHGMINKRDQEIEQLRTLLAAVGQAKPAQPEAPAASAETLITPKDEDAFGADLVDMARRAARQELSAERSRLEAHIQKLEEQLQGVTSGQSRIVQESFEDKLSKLAPNWTATNVDPDFMLWLQSEQPLTGLSRKAFFDKAASEGNAKLVAEFFNAYAPPVEAVKPPEVPKVDPRLEAQVAPSRGRAAPAPVASPAAKRTWSGSEIAQFYESKRTGKLRGAEADKIEADIFAAQREGRIAA